MLLLANYFVLLDELVGDPEGGGRLSSNVNVTTLLTAESED